MDKLSLQILAVLVMVCMLVLTGCTSSSIPEDKNKQDVSVEDNNADSISDFSWNKQLADQEWQLSDYADGNPAFRDEKIWIDSEFTEQLYRTLAFFSFSLPQANDSKDTSDDYYCIVTNAAFMTMPIGEYVVSQDTQAFFEANNLSEEISKSGIYAEYLTKTLQHYFVSPPLVDGI